MSTGRRSILVFLLSLLALPLAAQNFVSNGSFDNGLSGWEPFGDAIASGGVAVLNASPLITEETFPAALLIQCVPIQGDQLYRFAASIRVTAGGAEQVSAFAGFSTDPGCGLDTEEDTFVGGIGVSPSGTGTVEQLESFGSAPANAISAMVVLFVIAENQPVSAEFDNIVLSIDNAPRVAVVDFPEALVQGPGGGATTSYTIQNTGRGSTQVTLSQNGNFFTQSPTSFTLGPGESQVVQITGSAVGAGSYEGASIITGNGVPQGLSVPIRMVVTAPPSGPVSAAPSTNRLDLVSTSSSGPVGGTATFTNSGTGTLTGVLSSDVPWMIPQAGLVTIPPGQSVTVTFTIDPSRRGDGGDLGSETGTLFLTYLSGTAGKIAPDASPGSATSSVVVVHTVSPGSAPGQIPPLAPGEIALFMPGVAHVPGSVGTFISDISLASLGRTLTNLRLFFRPIGPGTTTLSSTIPQLVGDKPLLFGDLASTVFNTTNSSGTLQVRGQNVDRISAAASVFNASNARGTFGTAIPVFRSDRSASLNEQTVLTGVRADATTHTNVYVQEAAGEAVSFRVDFFNAEGVTVGGPATGALEPFALTQLGRIVPETAVTAVVTQTGGAGRLLSYATPVDRSSGDTWAVADWNRYYAAFPGRLLVPVAAAVRGANSTYFRTDVAVTSVGGPATGTLRFYSRTGEVVDQPITLGAQQSRAVNDVLVNLFARTGDQVGYLEYTPSTGSVAITSRTYTTVQGQAATFGTGVPTLPESLAISRGELRRFGGIEDSSLDSINRQRPGTFRTNIGLIETSGQAATVRLTLRFSAGTQASAVQAVASRTFDLTPRQFLQVNGISRALLGDRDAKYGDLRNMQLDVEVVSGGGSVMVYTSSTDNGTGDSILRTE
jgi:hypothetical protein